MTNYKNINTSIVDGEEIAYFYLESKPTFNKGDIIMIDDRTKKVKEIKGGKCVGGGYRLYFVSLGYAKQGI